MSTSSFYSIALAFLCALIFVNFSWAVKAHFIDPKERPLGMRIIFVASPIGVLASLLSYPWAAVSLVQFTLALALYAASLALFWWAIFSTRAAQRLTFAFSKDQPSFLVTSGPYELIRHPFYSSYLLFWLAGATGTGMWWLAVLFGIMAVLYWTAARAEESKFAGSDLAGSYAAYAARTRMFVPWAF